VLWLSTIIGWHRAVLSGFLPFWTGGIVKAILATATLQLIRKRRWKLAPYAR
jgi:biotin transport system substrate-specific component